MNKYKVHEKLECSLNEVDEPTRLLIIKAIELVERTSADAAAQALLREVKTLAKGEQS